MSQKEIVLGESFLASLSQSPSQLVQAWRLIERVRAAGFDWSDIEGVLAKIEEEVQEAREAIVKQESQERLEEEIGNLLFVCLTLCQWCKVDPEHALKRHNQEFISRFQVLEGLLQEKGMSVATASFKNLIEVWLAAKRRI